jgi:hypothetical protein
LARQVDRQLALFRVVIRRSTPGDLTRILATSPGKLVPWNFVGDATPIATRKRNNADHTPYCDRWKILRDNDYDPSTDIVRDWQGVWQLAGNKPRLRDDIRAYFRTRNEDDPGLSGSERTLV